MNKIGIDEHQKRTDFAIQTRGQQIVASPNTNWRHYYVEYKITFIDSEGRLQTTFRQKLYSGGGTLTRNQLLQMFQKTFDDEMDYEKFLYQGKKRAHFWDGAHDIRIEHSIIGAWIQHAQ